jgi:hypothetical protein
MREGSFASEASYCLANATFDHDNILADSIKMGNLQSSISYQVALVIK